MSTDSDELAPGTLIASRYRIVRKLGAGGMGAVYEAVQEGLGRKIALKVLLAAFAQNAEIVARFQREAQTAASLGHPNIVSVTDFGADGAQVFLVMEYLAGASLAQVIERERALSAGRAAWIGSQVLSALAVAHRAGIVHRDMKPDNVFLTEVSGVRDVVKVLDFGIARFTDAHGTNSKLTATGAVLGTPAYMSPEQARGRPVDARTDVYSTGVMLYEMLTGRLPFQATNYHALLFAILEETPPSIASLRADVPPGLVSVVERAMARDIDTRFRSADELRVALAPFVQQPSTASDAFAATAAMPQVAMVTQSPVVATSNPISAQTGRVGDQRAQPQPSVPAGALIPAMTPQPARAHAADHAPQNRSWLPLAVVSVIALASLGGVLGLVLRNQRASRRAALLEAQRTAWVAQQRALSGVANNGMSAPSFGASLVDVALASDASEPQPNGVEPPRPRGRARGNNTGVITVQTPSAPSGRRPVRTSLRVRSIAGGDRGELVRTLGPLMARIEACANVELVRPGEGTADGWSMDFSVALDPTSARVVRLDPRGDTIAKLAAVGCMRRTLVGQQLFISRPAPVQFALSFFNQYVR
ncbi:MAG: serine/threonine protein kinase [Myxococcales bacterium]|nr:serine/threonine protein kinase [Myxococcales bacterium]